jgi:ATP-dependent Lon protease
LPGEEKEVNINNKNLSDFLGIAKFKFGELEAENRVGIVTGLAWTEYGGEILKNRNSNNARVKVECKLLENLEM